MVTCWQVHLPTTSHKHNGSIEAKAPFVSCNLANTVVVTACLWLRAAA